MKTRKIQTIVPDEIYNIFQEDKGDMSMSSYTCNLLMVCAEVVKEPIERQGEN